MPVRSVRLAVLIVILVVAAVVFIIRRTGMEWRTNYVDDPKIIISKSARRLELYSGDARVKTYRIGLGFNPEGHKQKEGDGRTPEGEYTVCLRNPKSNFYLSLGLSYPNDRDAARGLEAGRITRAQHDEIVRAIRNKEKPPWNTPLGGEIFIHGHGSKSDWTLGCIALENEDIRELYERVPTGTPVIIRP